MNEKIKIKIPNWLKAKEQLQKNSYTTEDFEDYSDKSLKITLEGKIIYFPKSQIQFERIKPKNTKQQTKKTAAVFETSLIKSDYNYSLKVKSPDDIFNDLQDIKNSTKEMFLVYYLDTKNNVIAREIITIGILNASIIHARELFRHAVINNCNSIIIAHNHPSGDSNPSDDDKEITKNMINAGNILNIKILDHIIAGKETYFSFANNGLI